MTDFVYGNPRGAIRFQHPPNKGLAVCTQLWPQFRSALPRHPGNIQGELRKRELNLPHLHLMQRGKPETVHMLITYRECSDFHTHLLAVKIVKKYEYAEGAALVFNDLDSGVIVIASGFDHRMNPRLLPSLPD